MEKVINISDEARDIILSKPYLFKNMRLEDIERKVISAIGKSIHLLFIRTAGIDCSEWTLKCECDVYVESVFLDVSVDTGAEVYSTTNKLSSVINKGKDYEDFYVSYFKSLLSSYMEDGTVIIDSLFGRFKNVWDFSPVHCRKVSEYSQFVKIGSKGVLITKGNGKVSLVSPEMYTKDNRIGSLARFIKSLNFSRDSIESVEAIFGDSIMTFDGSVFKINDMRGLDCGRLWDEICNDDFFRDVDFNFISRSLNVSYENKNFTKFEMFDAFRQVCVEYGVLKDFILTKDILNAILKNESVYSPFDAVCEYIKYDWSSKDKRVDVKDAIFFSDVSGLRNTGKDNGISFEYLTRLASLTDSKHLIGKFLVRSFEISFDDSDNDIISILGKWASQIERILKIPENCNIRVIFYGKDGYATFKEDTLVIQYYRGVESEIDSIFSDIETLNTSLGIVIQDVTRMWYIRKG
jgi:hypothetical protein